MGVETSNSIALDQSGLWSRLRSVGDRLPFVPGRSIPDGLMALRSLEKRFGLIAAPLDDPTEEAIEDQVLPAVHTIGEDGIVDSATIVELRLMIPAEDLDDGFYDRASQVVDPATEMLEAEHDVRVVPNMHPIMPTEHSDSSVDAAAVWEMFSSELDLAQHQFEHDLGRRDKAALVTVAEPAYAAHIFGSRLLLGRELLDHSQPVILTPVGEAHDEHVLAPPVMH